MKLWLDLETYSEVPITHGTHAYAEAAEVMLFAWAIDDGPVQVWDCTRMENMPPKLETALNDPAVKILAHNSHIYRTVLENTYARDPDEWADALLEPPRWRDN
ncbi:MAG: DNA polymerase I, partial [Acidovorax sp.]|nr:DNA polymerase I [Acidovorax sp.]